jgi:hypothetical protein
MLCHRCTSHETHDEARSTKSHPCVCLLVLFVAIGSVIPVNCKIPLPNKITQCVHGLLLHVFLPFGVYCANSETMGHPRPCGFDIPARNVKRSNRLLLNWNGRSPGNRSGVRLTALFRLNVSTKRRSWLVSKTKAWRGRPQVSGLRRAQLRRLRRSDLTADDRPLPRETTCYDAPGGMMPNRRAISQF